jgi:outer membrane biosynthesis protein TonB
MWSRLITAFTALAFVVVLAAPTSMVRAETKNEPSAAQKTQQDKMRNCAQEWDRRKQTEGISGGDAYRAFMSICLKSETTDPRSVPTPSSAKKADKTKDEKKESKKVKTEKKEAKEKAKEEKAEKKKKKKDKDEDKDKDKVKKKKKKDKDEDKDKDKDKAKKKDTDKK